MIEAMVAESSAETNEIGRLDQNLTRHFQTALIHAPFLTRSLVSFQANKARPMYRWYKYKEAFSAALVEFLFEKFRVEHGKILDPFAGSGTALFVASEMGLDADGIELLPIGQEIIATKKLVEHELTHADQTILKKWAEKRVWQNTTARATIHELRITHGAYPHETHKAIERYMGALQQENSRVQRVLYFGLLCVLEQISYTRKDGQYLRWDYRSGRKQGSKPFDKGAIADFDSAISEKICEILDDLNSNSPQLSLFSRKRAEGEIHVLNGSCLELLPTLASESYDAIMTSPPYCNRYDYTRTYALELALQGIGEKELLALCQAMLSCTVENRAKDLLALNPHWKKAIEITDAQPLLQKILCYLDAQKAEGALNNNGIPRMVRGYFYEMACVIYECARVLKAGAPLFMVNDNVRYAGVSISVDVILSALAEKLGFRVEQILVLPTDKGNSSQQMGEHGRERLRKCVYVWKKL